MEDDIFIKVLKWAKEKGVQGFTFEEFDEEFENESLRTIAFKSTIYNSLREGVYSLNFEGRFKLLEYEELKEAREASLSATQQAKRAFKQAKRAFWISIIALAISSIFSFASIYFSINQADNPVKLESSQLKALNVSELIRDNIKKQKAVVSELKNISSVIEERNTQNNKIYKAMHSELKNITGPIRKINLAKKISKQ